MKNLLNQSMSFSWQFLYVEFTVTSTVSLIFAMMTVQMPSLKGRSIIFMTFPFHKVLKIIRNGLIQLCKY